MSYAPATTLWFARHEASLAWRDLIAMMTGGHRTRAIGLVVGLLVFAVILHLIAQPLVGPWAAAGITPDKPTLVIITGGGFLFWTVMLSQALESVTRAYYARADLDLILSSPANSRRLFAVRTSAIALLTVVLACLLASPVVDMLVIDDGPRWFAAYGVLAALGALSVAIAVLVTIALFRLIGPRRTRLIAQIVAGIIGAGFLIGIQVAAILGFGSLNRFAFFESDWVVAAAPYADSMIWYPARAAMGDLTALLIVMIVGFGSLALVIAATSSGFAGYAVAAAGVSRTAGRRRAAHVYRPATQKQALRRKEWKLLARDPWLLSQTLMQILYLLPPALMLWLNYGQSAGLYIVVVPVLVMAAGQLAGGLSWLAISGEDAHDLVVTAPIAPRAVLVAKIEAVATVIAVILAPLVLLIALSSPTAALVTACIAALATGSATAIQLWFRAQARRSLFRRRQVSSRLATVSEALASVMWAGAAAMLVTELWWVAVVPALLAAGVLGVAYALSPKSATARA